MEAEIKSLLDTFFSWSFEKEINDKMMYYSYSFEFDLVKKYIDDLLSIPMSDFIDYLIKHYDVSYLEARDVLQFSSFIDCTSGICNALKNAGDKGFSFIEIGRLLENDGIKRKDGAYLKYGENHSKTANELGLLNCVGKKYFLSCIGFVLCDLPDKICESLLNRLLLRNKLIKRLIYKTVTFGSDSYSKEVEFLSQSTRLRRKSNVKQLMLILCKSNEYDFTNIIQRIEF